MLDPLPILIARERVRAGVEERRPEPRRRAGVRRRLAAGLHGLARRIDPDWRRPEPAHPPQR